MATNNRKIRRRRNKKSSPAVTPEVSPVKLIEHDSPKSPGEEDNILLLEEKSTTSTTSTSSSAGDKPIEVINEKKGNAEKMPGQSHLEPKIEVLPKSQEKLEVEEKVGNSSALATQENGVQNPLHGRNGGVSEDDGEEEDDEEEEGYEQDDPKLTSVQRDFIGILQKLQKETYVLDPAVEHLLKENKISGKEYRDLLLNYPFPENYNAYVTVANSVVSQTFKKHQKVRDEETSIQERRLLDILAILMATATAMLAEKKQQTLQGMADLIRVVSFNLDQVRSTRRQFCTEALGLKEDKKEVRGIPAVPVLPNEEIKRIEKQKSLARSIYNSAGQRGSGTSPQRGSRSRFRGTRGGRRRGPSTPSQNSPNGPTQQPASPANPRREKQ